MRLVDRLQFFKDARWALVAILLVNLGGIAYGFYYYGFQFETTPAWLWPFVPDSPLAVLWAEAALVLYLFGKRRNDWVDAMAFVANVQVGLWTAFVLLQFPEDFRLYEYGLNFALFWLHLAMVALAFLFIPDLRRSISPRPRRWLAVVSGVLAWQLLNWWIDYRAFDLYGTGCSIRPYTIPCTPATEPLIAGVTLALVGLSVGAMAGLTRPRARTAVGARGK